MHAGRVRQKMERERERKRAKKNKCVCVCKREREKCIKYRKILNIKNLNERIILILS